MVKQKSRDPEICSEAAQTIQPHILYSRPRTRQLVTELLGGGVKPNERTQPFSFSMTDGHMYVNLEGPLLSSDMAVFQTPVSASIYAQRRALMEPLEAKLKAAREALKKAPKAGKEAAKRARDEIQRELDRARTYLPEKITEPTREQLVAYMKSAETKDKDKSKAFTRVFTPAGVPKKVDRDKEKAMVKRVGLLTLTSKMGCYSFNMPAGPLAHGFGGTCPASRFGFPMLTTRERTRHGQSEEFAQFAVDQESWLCSGCYGLKGLYGNPSMVFLMEARKQFIEGQLALDKRSGQDELVEIIVRAVRMGQVKSITERYFLKQMGMQDESWAIPDPEYFRWHDVGDAWVPGWQEAIFRICEALDVQYVDDELGLRLPAVKFWQPTRMWMLKGSLIDEAKSGGIPRNLSVRPSAAHFNQAPPKIAGLSAGSGSVCLSEEVTPQDRQNVERVLGTKLYDRGGKGWICPAYLRPEYKDGRRVGGGGAIIQKEKLKSGEVKEKLVGGACARAYGPDGQEPAPNGSGCRVCWDRPDLIVVYPEH